MSLSVRGKEIGPGQSKDDLPLASISFFDENRALMGRDWIGPWRGTFDWQRRSERFKVPAQCREAIVHIGLFGATAS